MVERRVMHADYSLPPGWKFEPLHKNCPKCGCDLSKEFVASENNEAEAEDIKGGANRLGVSRMAGEGNPPIFSGRQK